MERVAHRIMLLTGWRRAALAMAAGAATVVAQAPFHVFFVCFLTFPVLVWLLDGATAEPAGSRLSRLRPAFALGWQFGFGYFVAGLWWIGNALFVEAREFLWMWPFAILALPALLAVFYGLATAAAHAVWSDGIGRIAALAFGFGLAEWLRTFVLTGFPWNAIGYAAMPIPVLMQPASAIGVLGMNALAVFAFSLPAVFVQKRMRAVAAMIVLIGLVGGAAGYGYWRLQNAPSAEILSRIRIVQPAVDQSQKWDEARSAENFDRLLDLTVEANDAGQAPDVIVWPETAVPFILTERPDAVASIADALDEGQVLLAGAVRLSETETRAGKPAYFNSILALDGDGVIFDAADKKHLVPFGEYLPFAETFRRVGITAVAAADRGYSAAQRRRTLALPGGIAALPSICYEAIFPSEIAADGEPPNLIVNVTNDAWYGNTPGPYQHAHQARIRAVENGLPLVRAANNGISAAYDGYGRQLAALGYGATGAIEASIPAALEATFYQRAGRVSIAAILLGLLAVAAVSRVLHRRHRSVRAFSRIDKAQPLR